MKWPLFTIIRPRLRRGVCLVLHKFEGQKIPNMLVFCRQTPFSKKNVGFLLISFLRFVGLSKHKQGPMKQKNFHTTFEKATYKATKVNDVF